METRCWGKEFRCHRREWLQLYVTPGHWCLGVNDSWSLVSRCEWLLCLGMNDSPPLTWMTPRSFSRLAFMFRSDSLHAIYYTVDLFNTITDRVYIIILLQDQIYSTGDWTQLWSHRWIIEWLTWICLPDCPPQSISTLPATTLKCSDANVSGVSSFPFSPWRMMQIRGSHSRPRGSHCRLRHKCSGSCSRLWHWCEMVLGT